jgi:hypothetical protein
MPDGADVRSIEAVRDWHAALTNYADSLAESLAGIELEIRRAYDWLDEQLASWRRAVRDCEEEVVRAKAELSQRKFKTWDDREPDCTVQEKALRLARARLQHAEDQVEKVRHWIGRVPKLVDELYRGSARRLTNFIEDDLIKGRAELIRRLAALETYAGLRPDFAPGSAGSSAPVANAPGSPGNNPTNQASRERQRPEPDITSPIRASSGKRGRPGKTPAGNRSRPWPARGADSRGCRSRRRQIARCRNR